MQIHISNNGMRIVGKAWEVRARLKSWSAEKKTLQEFIESRVSNMSQRPALIRIK